MADKEIADLTAAGALTGDELLHIIQSGNSRKVTAQEVADLVDPGEVLPAIGTGDAGKVLAVNVTEDGTEWVAPAADELPAIGTGDAGKVLAVNVTEDGTEWISPSANELPAIGTGDAGKVLAVNVTEDGTEWVTPSGGGGGDELPAIGTGDAGRMLVVNSTEDGVEWVRRGVLSGVVTESGTSRTLGLSDIDRMVRCTSGSATTITVPADGTTNFPVGSVVTLSRAGSGSVTIAGAGGVTINTAETLILRKQHSVASLMKVAANTWLLTGDLELV